jgi:adenylate cyclase
MRFSVSLPQLFPNPLSFFMEVSMSFWKELSRRNVVKVGIAYAVAAWLIIHPVDIIFPILHLPEWSVTLVAAFLIIAFPFVLIFSWIYEVTPKGLKKTKEVPISKSITHLTGKRLNYIIVGLLVVALGYFVFDKYFIGRGAVENKKSTVVTSESKTKKTIAVLPFADLSPAKDQEYFVDGLSEEILNSLAHIPELTVIAKTSSFSFKGKDKTIQEIAGVLGVENILEGSVRKAGNALRITAQLVSGVDGSHLWSETYDRELKDIFIVQEDIATAVASALKATLGIGKSIKQLGGTDNVEAYGLYLVAKGQDDNSRALESVNASIALDPKFALAWSLKAYIHGILRAYGPASRAVTEGDAALSAVQKAIELEPNLADGYLILSFLKTQEGKFVEAEYAIRKAFELATEGFSGATMDFPALHYMGVGNFKKAYEILGEARLKDPLNEGVRVWYMSNFVFLGNLQQAEDEYKRAEALLGDKWEESIGLVRLNFGEPFTRDDIVSSNMIDVAAKDYINSPKEGIEVLQRLYSDKNKLTHDNLMEISLWAAYFGDSEFSMDAIEKGLSLEAFGVVRVWYPILKEVRQTPRFKALVKEIGLVDYWNKFGWPDICHKLDNGDFVCD